MIQERSIQQLILAWLPPATAVVLIVLFAALANWQLDRAAEKEALEALYDADTAPLELASLQQPEIYQRVTAAGRYLSEKQFLIDNIVHEGHSGYYVITPFEQATDGKLLLVNRGWINKDPNNPSLPSINVSTDVRSIEGRVGRLPRVALRPKRAVLPDQGWPKLTVYPRLEDLAPEIGKPLAAPVLLLSPDDTDGFVRSWQPPARGSMTNYGYAFQWSAMALTVFIILIYQLRKKLRHERKS